MTAFTKEGIRKALAASWSTMTGIPVNVVDLGALVDPAANRLVVWNDTSNHIEYLDPALLPYDHTISGLTATLIKTAIDELKASIGAGSIFRGYVGADGTTGNRLPAGWSAVRTGGAGSGAYEVTHNLGLADLTRLAFSPIIVASSGNKHIYQTTGSTGNKVVLNCVDAGTGAASDQAFSFMAGQT